MTKIEFYYLDENYYSYIQKFDNKVMYNKKETRPYIGVVLEINDCYYFAPMTSPKEKYKNIADTSSHIYKIKNGELGYICLNNMIPLLNVPKSIIINDISDIQYANLLKEQFLLLKNDFEIIKKNAFKIYTRYKKIKGLKHICVDFKRLEYCAKCYDYAIENNIEINDNLVDVVKSNKSFEDFKKNYIKIE